MSPAVRFAIAAPILVALGAGGAVTVMMIWHPESSEAPEAALAGSGDEGAPDAEPPPVAGVQVATVTRAPISRATDLYGSVIARPGALVATATPLEISVRRVLVSPGQTVGVGDPLVEVEPGRAARQEVELAESAATTAHALVEAANERLSAHLGTRQDVLQAEGAAREADVKLAQLRAALQDAAGTLHATVGGLVSDVHVQGGSLAPAGTVLIEVLPADARVVRLGVLPSDAARVAPGQTLRIVQPALESDPGITGRVLMLGSNADPTTHLLDVLVALPDDASPALGTLVRARLETTVPDALIVPHAALLPEGSRYVVYTVADGHARRHELDVGIQTREAAQIVSDDIHPGDTVVILGNDELTDGMPVRVEPPR